LARFYTALVMLLTLSAFPRPVQAEVRILRVPEHGQVPDVALDAKGVLHLTYGLGAPGNGFYVQSRDLGKTFTKPLRLNHALDTVTTGMERGPKLALGRDGMIHVLWHGFYKKGGGVWYTRSSNGGKTFEPERNLVHPNYGTDNAAIAADGEGNVFALWTGGFPGVKPDPDSPVASPIVLVRSADNGRRFSANELLRSDHPASGRACGCCRLTAQVGSDGNLYVAFRGGYRNLRDPYFLSGKKTENNFHCLRVSEDNWSFG
jgi:hypothetical protein